MPILSLSERFLFLFKVRTETEKGIPEDGAERADNGLEWNRTETSFTMPPRQAVIALRRGVNSEESTAFPPYMIHTHKRLLFSVGSSHAASVEDLVHVIKELSSQKKLHYASGDGRFLL